METSLLNQVRVLVAGLTVQLKGDPLRSFMSASVYDTAWLAMIQHPRNMNSWLFPECFDFVLKTQLPGGGWDAYASNLDGILNTSASLLAIKKHLKLQPLDQSLTHLANKAEKALTLLLENWDVSMSDQVGFELLVSKHISMLREEGVSLEFGGLGKLNELYQEKVARLPLESVYKGVSTLYHSLEALIGHIDFDRVAHSQEENGSMLGSPSSTAAFLIHSSQWNPKAEEYLRNVLRNCADLGGGVPSAWPTTIFETSWVTSILFEAAIPIGEDESLIFRDFLEQSLTTNHGIVGFSPSSLPDADDTSKTIIALRHLGVSAPVTPLLDAFEAGSHFKTYQDERNSSFSVNCNVLICLLMLDDPKLYVPQICKIADFVCVQASTSKVNDKWHCHDLYWMMLLCQALAALYEKMGDSVLCAAVLETSPQLRERIPLISLHILMRILAKQEPSGSWSNMCETTAYAILALSAISRLPWAQDLHDDGLSASIDRGKQYLYNHRDQWGKGKFLWIEKVSFASNVLSEAYCLAAVSTQPTAHHQRGESNGFSLPKKVVQAISKCAALVWKTPLFSAASIPALRMAEMQACYTFCLLQRHPLDIFPQNGNDYAKYKIITPIIWTACNVLQGCCLSVSDLLEMVNLSMLIYQVDEFMELTVERNLGDKLPLVDELISKICISTSSVSGVVNEDESSSGELTALPVPPTNAQREMQTDITNVERIVTSFIQYALKNSAVVKSPLRLQTILKSELETFLRAHIVQAADNKRFAVQHGSNRAAIWPPKSMENPTATTQNQQAIGETVLQFRSPGRTFYKWVHTIGADHTSCPFSYIFYHCLLFNTRPGSFATAKTSYLAEDLCRHLASLCRMYNDIGSLWRDQDEYNLNSVNFPEFQNTHGGRASKDIQSELRWIAEYERTGLEKALSLLESELEVDLIDALKVFINVTDLYGQVYLQSDLTARKAKLH
ncbi:Ent-kaurene synthase [Nemania sp. FL0031]|nr:Ent-kaurene synthase [Nemania sp. FL0031]